KTCDTIDDRAVSTTKSHQSQDTRIDSRFTLMEANPTGHSSITYNHPPILSPPSLFLGHSYQLLCCATSGWRGDAASGAHLALRLLFVRANPHLAKHFCAFPAGYEMVPVLAFMTSLERPVFNPTRKSDELIKSSRTVHPLRKMSAL
ncbi:hypothetical protein BgiBS90_036496, partial [Biomphalaria glabrata]